MDMHVQFTIESRLCNSRKKLYNIYMYMWDTNETTFVLAEIDIFYKNIIDYVWIG